MHDCRRTLSTSLLLLAGLWLLPGRAGAGAVFISGDDADDANHCQGTACGALYPNILRILYAECEPVPTHVTGILAIGVNGDPARSSLEGWNDVANGGPGAPITYVTLPAFIRIARFDLFRMLYIPTTYLETLGGINDDQLEALNSRQADIKDYLNNQNGRLLSMTEAESRMAYGWLPNPLNYIDVCDSDVAPTAAMDNQFPGSGATDVNMDHICYHTIWTGPAGWSGLQVLAVSNNTSIVDPEHPGNRIPGPVIVGGCNIKVTTTDCKVDIHNPDCWVCGNGRVDPGEECDDGNLKNGDGCSSTCHIEVPNRDPVCQLWPGPRLQECAAGVGVSFLDATNSSDPDGDPLSYEWTSNCPGAVFSSTTAAMPQMTATGPPPCPVDCTITLTVKDGRGGSSSCNTQVVIQDTIQPLLTAGKMGACYRSTAELEGAALAATTAVDSCAATVTRRASTTSASGCHQSVKVTGSDGCLEASVVYTRVVDGTAPVVTAPAPSTLECTAPGGIVRSDPRVSAWIASGTAVDGCGAALLANDAPGFFPSACAPGAPSMVTFSAADECGNLGEAVAALTVVDATGPTLDVPAPLDLECDQPGGIPGSDPRIVAWLASVRTADVCGVTARVVDDAPAMFSSGCAPGTTTVVRFQAKDNCGNATVKSSTVTLVDTTAPALTGCTLTPVPPPGARLPGPARTSSSCAPTGIFQVGCGSARDACDSQPLPRRAEVVSRRHEVRGALCTEVEEVIAVGCDEVVDLRVIATPCPAKSPRSARPALSVVSGRKIISGERLELRVVASDACGNAARACSVDPLLAPDPAHPPLPLLCAPPPKR